MVCEGISDILVKNSYDIMELCKKCERKLVNGVHYARCKNGLQWKCVGVSKDSVKSEVIATRIGAVHSVKILARTVSLVSKRIRR